MAYRYYSIVPDAAGDRVLLLRSPEGWTLPYFDSDDWVIWQQVDHVNRQVSALLEADVTTLRCLQIIPNPDLGSGSPIYAMESHGSTWSAPTDGRLVTHAEFQELDLAIELHRPIIDSWFDSAQAAEPHPLTSAWYQPGWFQLAADWMTSECARLGIELIAPIEQLRQSQRSSVLRAKTMDGSTYLKAVPEMFRHESALTVALSERFPSVVPQVLALGTSRNWMLIEGCGDHDLAASDDVGLWQAALGGYAEIQVELAQQTGMLFGLGCPDRQLDNLRDSVDPLLNHVSAMLPDTRLGFTWDEIEALRARASEFKEACSLLSDFAVPHTLEHGDFGYWQVVVSGDRYCFIDWSDSSVSHPFFSVWFLIEELKYGAPKMVSSWKKLRDSYLEVWTGFEPMERLVEAFDLARPLAALHQASIYYQTIVPQIEAKWEWEKMVPYFLRRLSRDPESA